MSFVRRVNRKLLPYFKLIKFFYKEGSSRIISVESGEKERDLGGLVLFYKVIDLAYS